MRRLGGVIVTRLKNSVREVVFGFEDSLVSTLGTVSGVAVGSADPQIVILSGLVLVVVEAISMSAGSFLSSKAAVELYDERLKQDASRALAERVTDKESLRDLFERKGFSKDEIKIALTAITRERKLWLEEVGRAEYRMSPAVSEAPWLAGLVMGVCYIFGGFLVLLPYFFLPLIFALPLAMFLTITSLFILGFFKAKLAGTRPVRSGIEMVSVSLTAALIGIFIGRLMRVAL